MDMSGSRCCRDHQTIPPVDTRATAASVGREQPHPGRLEESIEMDGNGNALSLAVHERMAAQAIT